MEQRPAFDPERATQTIEMMWRFEGTYVTGTADPKPSQPDSMSMDDSPRNSASLDVLLRLTGQGDVAAFGELYDLTATRVFGLSRSILGNQGYAEDATQDVYFEIWRRAASFDSDRGPAISWMLMLTHARSVDRVRRTETLLRNEDSFARQFFYPDVDSAIEHIIRADNDRQAHAALAALTPLQRQAIQLTYFLGHSNPEASRLLGVPLPTFKDRIRAALKAMRSSASGG